MHNPILPPQQLSILNRCFHPSGAFIEFKQEELEQSIPDRFEEQVRRFPDRLAIKTRTQELTYDELNRAANCVAHSILAILGALKAGKVYFALDRLFPTDRLEYVLGNSDASLILTNSQNLSSAEQLIQDQSRLINIDDWDSSLSDENPGLPISPGRPASITYTSGSTGEPKGVVNSHRDILHMVSTVMNYFHICEEDRLVLLSSYGLQGGTGVIFPSLCVGACILPLDLKEEEMNHVGEWISQQGVTLYFSVATVFRQMASSIKSDEKLPTVRAIGLAGEPVDHRDVEFFRRHFSKDCIFVNRLGGTETAFYSMYFMDPASRILGNLVPAGYPLAGKEVLLIDESGIEIVSEGIGEIAVRSPFISLGYWQLPEQTQAVFRTDPDGGESRTFPTGGLGQRLSDGSLSHLGRKDFQVKIRENRVEVAEIELALLAHKAVEDAAVVPQDDRRGEKHLAGYLVIYQKIAPSDHDLRRFLRPNLPEYMIPSTFVRMGSLPKIASGKIDRSALPLPGHGRLVLKTPFVATRSLTEQVLADIWAEVLEVDWIGRDDDFLDLGGDSLLAAALLNQVEESFQKKLPLATLIEASTVAQMAKMLSQERWSSSDPCLAPIQPKGQNPPFFCVHGSRGHVLGMAALARRLGENYPFYGLESAGRDGKQQPLTEIEAMATRYISEIRTVQPEGPYYLGGYSMGGAKAFEMAQQLQADGRDVALLSIFDSNCPGLNSAWRRREDFVIREMRNAHRLLRHNPETQRRLIWEKIEIITSGSRIYSPVDDTNRKALKRYIPHPYPGEITFLWANDRQHGPSDLRLGWEELAEQGIDIQRVPGDHYSMLREPQIQVLAECLKVCMDNAVPT